MIKCFQLSFLFLNICIISVAVSQSDDSQVNSTVTDAPIQSTTTTVNNITCGSHDNDCKSCVAYSGCYYCETDNKCHKRIADALTGEECSINEIKYLTCRVNLKYMLIGIGVLSLVAFLIITIFCCICCCRKKGLKISKDDLKWTRQREERKQIQMERRQERAERTEEIRKKYGLTKGSNPYQRFDA